MDTLRHLLALIAVGFILPAHAVERPLWEAGVGLGFISFPDYRGSDERSSFLLPFPYVIYRGDVLKMDGEKIRGLFFESDRIQSDISLSGSIPVNSSSNNARKGMPDLDPTFEIGPSLMFNVARSQDKHWELELRLPLRFVGRVDFPSVRYAGWIFNPHFNLDVKNVWPGPDWNLGFSAGPVFADKRYHRYFYNVDAQYATAERPQYSADGGFSGLRATASMSKRFPKYWIGGFVRYDSVSGAAFESSPLVTRDYGVSAGIAIAWIFSQSGRLVESDK